MNTHQRIFNKCLDDIDKARSYNFDGVVFGATLLNGELDQEFLDELISYSRWLKKTLHRAVDTIPKTIEAVEIAINLGFDTILSSGGYETAYGGIGSFEGNATKSIWQD